MQTGHIVPVSTSGGGRGGGEGMMSLPEGMQTILTPNVVWVNHVQMPQNTAILTAAPNTPLQKLVCNTLQDKIKINNTTLILMYSVVYTLLS